MRKRIIITAVALVVLVGAYFGITNLNMPQDEIDRTLPDVISIFKTEKENIKLMNIATADFEYAFYAQEDKWAIRGKEEIKLYNVKVDNLAYDFSSINAETIIDNVSDYSIFGFENPTGTPFVALSDGTEKHFIIGSKTPTGSSYYFKTADDDTIYTVYSSKIESFIAPEDTYRERSLAKINPEELIKIQILRSDADIVLQLKTEQESQQGTASLNPWKMVSPFQRDVSSDYFSMNVMEKITDINIETFVDDNPASYAKYGLDKPTYTISFTEQDKQPITLLLGEREDNGFYVKIKDEKAVYTVLESAFGYRDVNPTLLIDTLVYLQMIDTVDAITLSNEGAVYNFKIEHQDENSLYFINGNAADESAFKKIYQEIIGLTLRGIVAQAPQGQPIFTAVFAFNDGREDDIVEGVAYQDRYVAIKINGRAEYYVLKEQVLNMIEKIKAFAENPSK
ncbi:MAG: DUF4340 domain-containing protein [Firmicutes bacterium]|nr:DUF4340 domain-containing protein [Bacillota bacterium]